jgi:Type II intron maturase
MNYYRFAENFNDLSSKVQYILKESCAKLLAVKFSLKTQGKVFAKYGKNLKGQDKHQFTDIILGLKPAAFNVNTDEVQLKNFCFLFVFLFLFFFFVFWLCRFVLFVFFGSAVLLFLFCFVLFCFVCLFFFFLFFGSAVFCLFLFFVCFCFLFVFVFLFFCFCFFVFVVFFFVFVFTKGLSKASLENLACSVFGSEYRVEMHHIRKMKDLNPKARYIDKIMARKNRKQVPLCRKCHIEYHNSGGKSK